MAGAGGVWFGLGCCEDCWVVAVVFVVVSLLGLFALKFYEKHKRKK